MRKFFVLLLIILILPSCKFDVATNILNGVDENPFLNNQIMGNSSEDILHFLVFSDLHINREKEDTWATERTKELTEHLEKGQNSNDPYDFIISLGDIEDVGNIEAQELKDFLAFIRDKNITMVTAFANHELQEFRDRKQWDSLYESYGIYGTLGRYSFGPLSIYSLDSSKRLYGREQLDYLEEGLKADDNRYKIFITHTNTFSGGTFDLSLILFGSADIIERNKIYSLMNDYGVGMLFNGHYHRDTIITRHADRITEYNLSSAHSFYMTGIPGSLYECYLDTNSGELTINIYCYNHDGTLELSGSDTFNM